MAEGFVLSIDDSMLKKLDEADAKIEKLQQTSEKTSASIVDSFKKMATGVQPFIEKLREADTVLSKLSAPNISSNSFTDIANEAEKTAVAIADINAGLSRGLSVQEKERKNYIEKYAMYQRMFDSIQKQTDAQERLAKAEEARNRRVQSKAQDKEKNAATRAEEQYERALNKTEVTIANRARKIEALANAERALLQTGRSYSTEINKIRTETERLNKANEDAAKSTENIKKNQRNLIDTSAQLERKLALLFSVSQIEGYIMKLVNIRGEFELQNRALQAILQNKDEANKLFEQITELAIRSPFRVKELVTYTKELAAYRIETEKLYDTTKMLADVSAGLGVDMSRLILAYGQVKAANYLRGTELRQFSEAGINILGELSTYFTELEGRVVSVGDVFERVTKRMVSFGDVEEIFKRITSAGGIFYNMQEIQAETLQGQISNLYDSIDIMFNEIGKANDSILKNTVALLRTMVENWESIANAIVPVITAFAAYKGIIFALIGYEKLMVALRAVSNSQLALQNTLLVKSANGQTLFNIASKANPYLIVGAVVISAIMGIYNSIKSARQEQEKFNKTVSEGVMSANEMAANFKRLADIATDSSKSTKEQNEALAELKRTYSDILPTQTLQIENLKAMKGNYDAVTSAIYAKIEAQTKENLSQEIQNEYGGKAADTTDKLIKKLKQFNISADASRTILAEFRKRFDEGFINSPQKAQVELQNLIESYTGKKVSLTQSGFFEENGIKEWGKIVISEVSDVFYAFNALDLKMRSLNDLEIKPFQIGGGTAIYAQFQKQLNDISSYTKEWKEANKDKLNPFELNEEAQRLTIAKYTNFIDDLLSKIKTGKFKDNDIEIANMAIEQAQKAIDNFNGSKIQQEVKNIFMSFAKANNISLEGMDKLLLGSEEGLKEYSKRVKDLLTDFEERIALFNKNPFLSPYTKEQISLFKQQKPLLENQYSKVHVATQKELNKENKTAAQILKERIDLIKETNKQYEKLLKNYSKEEAANKVRASYAETWKDLLKGTSMEGSINTMDFDIEGTIKALEELGKKAAPKLRKELLKAIDGLKAEVDLDVTVKRTEQVKTEIENLFSGYELSFELEKLNLPPGVAKQLFDIDAFNIVDLRKKMQPYLTELRSGGETQVKLADEIEKKISEMQDKELRERIIKFSEYLKKATDEVKRVQDSGALEIAFATQLSDQGKLTVDQYSTAIRQIIEKTNKEISKIQVDKFKNSNEYIRAMGDLSAYSARELDQLAGKIQDLINKSAGQMSASDLKVYTDALAKIREQLDNVKNPFDKSYFSQVKQLKDLEKEYAAEKENYNALLKQQELDTLNLAEAERKLAEAKQNAAQQGTSSPVVQADLKSATDNVVSANQALNSTNNNLNVSQGKMSAISGKMGQFTQGASAAMSMIDMIVRGIYQSIKATIELFNDIKELAESAGADVDTGGWRDAAQAMEVLGNVNEKVMGSWEDFKSGNIAGAFQKAVGAVTSVFKTLNQQHDKRRQQAIEKEEKRLKQLERSYQKLEKAINGAYSMEDLNETNKQAQDNIDEQIASYESMLASERDKKKQDDEKIKEYQNNIEDLQEKKKELAKEKISDLGGFGTDSEIKSAAQEFVDAWLTAFNETGNGLTGLQDKMDDFILNAVKSQLLAKLAKDYVTPILDSFNNMFAEGSPGGGEMTKEELEAWKELYERNSKEFDEKAKAYMEALGIKPTGETELSGLQKGIQGITETTAEALEALLNSVRFFVSDSNSVLKSIYNLFSNVDIPNPILSELRAQTMVIRNIYDLFNGMTAPHPTLGGRGLKSVI